MIIEPREFVDSQRPEGVQRQASRIGILLALGLHGNINPVCFCTPESAAPIGFPVDTAVGEDHRSIVKPADPDALSFRILREFALSPVGQASAERRRAERRATAPDLIFSDLRAEDPPPHSEAGRADFELINAGSGKAVMTGLHIEVLNHGPSEIPKMVEAAAPVPQYSYRVTLEPEVSEYDVRQREFGVAPPHSYEAQEVETFAIELRSTEPQWYELRFVAFWYDSTAPDRTHRVESEPLRVEFRPDVRDVL